MPDSILINGRAIGNGLKPYVIAEISANHNGSKKNALALIELAAKAGADAVKIQTYRPDTITIDCNRPEFKIKSGLWAGRTLYDLYAEAHTPWEWHHELFSKAREVGITLFSSPFDRTAIDLLESLDTPAYKIASFELIDHELISYAAQTGKPLIMSTGMADKIEISEAIKVARQAGCEHLSILHCISGYPAPAEDYNLNTITDMQQSFCVPVGLSDHTIGNETAIASVALGAAVVEKHFTMDRDGGGPDDSFSIDSDGLASLSASLNLAWKAMGTVNYNRKKSESPNLIFRRSLYLVKDIKEGEQITREHIRSVRPGYGASPKDFDLFVGKIARSDAFANSPLKYELIEK